MVESRHAKTSKSDARRLVYHVLNRTVAGLPLFRKEGDYESFERGMIEAHERHPLRILAWCLMRNHWHFVVWPRGEGEVTAYFRWLAHPHAMRKTGCVPVSNSEQMTMLWSEISMRGVMRIDHCVAVFDVWVDEALPFAKFKIKILERRDNDFLGVPNVAIVNPLTREPQYISGLGDTIADALKDTLDHFFQEVDLNAPNRPLAEEDFIWSAPEDF